jgi:hypothetical protein
MSYTTFTGPVRSLNGFATPVRYITSADVSPITIDAGSSYVILATAQGGPDSIVTLVLPQVTSGTFTPTAQPADANYNGIRGQVYNQDPTLVHVLKGFGTQPVNENADGVDIAVNSVVQWVGNGNQSAPWLAVANALAADHVAP